MVVATLMEQLVGEMLTRLLTGGTGVFMMSVICDGWDNVLSGELLIDLVQWLGILVKLWDVVGTVLMLSVISIAVSRRNEHMFGAITIVGLT